MIAAIPMGLLCGLLLGGRFKVFVTIPVEFAALLIIGGLAASGAMLPSVAALTFLAFSISLQAGYVAMLMGGARLQRNSGVRSFQA